MQFKNRIKGSKHNLKELDVFTLTNIITTFPRALRGTLYPGSVPAAQRRGLSPLSTAESGETNRQCGIRNRHLATDNCFYRTSRGRDPAADACGYRPQCAGGRITRARAIPDRPEHHPARGTVYRGHGTRSKEHNHQTAALRGTGPLAGLDPFSTASCRRRRAPL